MKILVDTILYNARFGIFLIEKTSLSLVVYNFFDKKMEKKKLYYSRQYKEYYFKDDDGVRFFLSYMFEIYYPILKGEK